MKIKFSGFVLLKLLNVFFESCVCFLIILIWESVSTKGPFNLFMHSADSTRIAPLRNVVTIGALEESEFEK